MTDKDLIAKLNSLKNINPDQNWLMSNRELLLSQISNSGARELSTWRIFVINFNSFAKAASRPAYALGVFVFILVTASLFSHQVFSSAKPNDSLYIARIISEKAKLNTVFNSDERNKLAVQFATEHAQDISAVLADPQFNNDSNKDQVAKLNASFNKEIDTVKTRIGYLSPKNETNNNTEVSATDTVSMANSLKDKDGVELFEDKNLQPSTTPAVKATSVLIMPAGLLASSSTSSPIEKVETNQETEIKKAANADIILDEAKQLFDNKDYNKAADKLKEVDAIIKN